MMAPGALVEHNSEDAVAFFGNRFHLGYLLRVDTSWFLHEGVKPLVEGLDGERWVILVWGGDQNGIDRY